MSLLMERLEDRLPKDLRGLPRRARSALGVLVVTLLVALVTVPVLMIFLTDAEDEAAGLRRQIQGLRGQIAQARADYAFVQDNRVRYMRALERGLFRPQDRLEAKDALDELFAADYLAGLTYEFAAASAGRPDGAEHDVVSTPLNLEVGAMLDGDVYAFVRDMEARFPGFPVLKRLTVTRGEPLTQQALERIARGEAVPLVRATLSYDWRSAVPPNQGEGQ